MVRVSKHASQRLKERCGLKKKVCPPDGRYRFYERDERGRYQRTA